MLLFLNRLHILASDQIIEDRNKKEFLFFSATFEQLFEKFGATFWEISTNLWQALDDTNTSDGSRPELGGYGDGEWGRPHEPSPRSAIESNYFTFFIIRIQQLYIL